MPASEIARALASSLKPAASALLARLAEFAAPPVCIGCRAPLAEHDALCAACWLKVDFIRPPLCDRLGTPMAFGEEAATVSAAALADPPAYDRLRAVARHAGLARDLAHRLKYGDQHYVLPLLARWMTDAGRALLADCDLLLPIPLARQRLWRRGFNQAALIAERVGRTSGVHCDPFLLERRRETPSQVGLNRDERRLNVRGAFAVAPGRSGEVAGRKIALLDDVVTTGATVEEAARALRRAGAARVDVLCVTLVTQDSSWRSVDESQPFRLAETGF